MLKSIQQTIISMSDGHSGMGGIRVLSGNPVQTYNKDTDEYEPDRSILPCVLMPWFSAADTEGVMTGSQTVTGAEWYEGAPKEGGSNRITNETAGYEVSASGMPEWSLKVKKNIPADDPVELYCTYYITNKKTGVTERYEASVALRTSVFDSANFSLKTDMPNSYAVDPLQAVADSEGRWLVTYNAQLYNGTEKVPDANAVYWWQKKEDGAWRSFTQDELDLYATVSGKKLTIDARLTEGMESYRVMAAYYATGTQKPSSPPTGAWQCTSTLKLEMPKTLKPVVVQKAGAKMNSTFTSTVIYECRMTYNRQVITGKDDFFRFTWKGKSGKTGSSVKVIGTGKQVSFTPASKGFDKGYPVEVWCEVETFTNYAIVTQSGKVVTSGGKAVISKVFN